MSLPILILAGGLATRLRPLTETLPKSMIPIAGEPFIAAQLKLLRQAGIKTVFLCLGYLGEQVQAYVEAHQSFGLDVKYFYDGDTLLGTAGAIKRILHELPETFMVTYGDSYLIAPYADIARAFLESQKLGLMTVFHNQNAWDKSNIEFKHGKIIVYDKNQRTDRMHYIDYGLGVFHRAAFASVPTQQCYDLATVYQHLLNTQQLAAFEVSQRFYEVGSHAGIAELNAYLNKHTDPVVPRSIRGIQKNLDPADTPRDDD